MSATTATGNVGTRLLLENERVKVWEMQLDPGEESDLHTHTMDYVLCILEGTSIDADAPDRPPFHGTVEPGQVIYIRGGRSERAVNRSDVRFREIIVELKDKE
jgi:hypothetical protein